MKQATISEITGFEWLWRVARSMAVWLGRWAGALLKASQSQSDQIKPTKSKITCKGSEQRSGGVLESAAKEYKEVLNQSRQVGIRRGDPTESGIKPKSNRFKVN